MSTEEPEAGQKKGGLESLSHDDLVSKCKTLLNIAQKAKKAKDDALEELVNQELEFKEELKAMKEKATVESSNNIQIKKNLLDLQLEFEVCQKKMATLEDENKLCNARIKEMEKQLAIENDKRKTAELLNSNLNEDLNKLTESSNQMRLICNRVIREKEDIEEESNEIYVQKSDWTKYLQRSFPHDPYSTVADWIAILEKNSRAKETTGTGELEEKVKLLNNCNKELKVKLEKLISEKEVVETENSRLKNEKVKIVEELTEVRASRDVLLKKMDEVRVETSQLIDNSEKLSEEIGALRLEKNQLETSFNNISTEHLKSLNELKNLKTYNDELVSDLENLKVKLEKVDCDLNRLNSEYILLKAENDGVVSRNVEMENCVRVLNERIVELNRTVEDCASRESSEKLQLSIENADVKKQLENALEEKDVMVKQIRVKDEILSDFESKCKNFENEIEILKQQIVESEKCHDRIVDEKEEMMKLELEKKEIVSKLEAKCGKLKHELDEYKQKLKEMESSREKIVEEKERIEKRELEKNEIVSDLESKCKSLESKLDEFRQNVTEGALRREKMVEREIERFERKELENNEIVEKLEAKCKKLEMEIDEMRQEVIETQRNRDEIVNETVEARKKEEENNEVVNGLKMKCRKLEDEIDKLKEVIRVQDSSKDELVKDLEAQCLRLRKVEEIFKQESDENAKTKEEFMENSQADYKKLENEMEELVELKNNKISELEKSVEIYKAKESNLERNIELLKEEIENCNSELLASTEKLKDLSKRLSESEASLNLSQKENFEILGRLKENEEETKRMAQNLGESETKVEKLESELQLKSIKIDELNSANSSNDFERLLEEKRKIIVDTNKVLNDFFKVISKSVGDDLLSEMVGDFVTECGDCSIDKIKLESVLKSMCRSIVDKAQKLEELESSLRTKTCEKDEIEKENGEVLKKLQEFEKEVDSLKMSLNSKEMECNKNISECENLKTCLDKCEKILSMTNDNNTEEIDDLKCKTGKLESLLTVFQMERKSIDERLRKSEEEKLDLVSQVEKLRMEDEENLHNLQDLNDRYVSMEEKLNFIFSENEDLKGKVVELEEMHDNLLREIENLIANNVEILPENVAHDFTNKSVKSVASDLLQYLIEIVASLKMNIKEKDSKIEANGEELEMMRNVFNKHCSFESNSLKCKEDVLLQIVDNSQFFDELSSSYAKIVGSDLQESRKALKLKFSQLKENGWKFVDNESVAKTEDAAKAKNEELEQLQEKNRELKAVAMKMKKKINDLNQSLETEKQKLDAERAKLNQLSAVAKNAQMLQLECDRLVDELEECKKSMKQLKKLNENLETEQKDLQEKFNEKENKFVEIEREMAAIRNQLDSALSREMSLTKELEEIKAEKHVEEVIRKECEKELIMTQDKLRKTQLELEQVQLQTQKHTVLTQEKHDYEQQLSQSRQNLTQLESQVKEQGTTLSQLTEQLENERRDKDELAEQLTILTAETQKAAETARIQNEALLNRVGNLDMELRLTVVQRNVLEEEVERLGKEFTAYKVRAQSVLLRQKEQGGGSAEQEAKDKCAELQELCDRTKAQLDNTVQELEQVKLRLRSTIAEKEALDKKCENVSNTLGQRNKEIDRRIIEHRQHKLSTDTLIQCYKTQLEEKERGHQIELDSLRSQLAKLSSRINNNESEEQDGDAQGMQFVADLDSSHLYHQSALNSSSHSDLALHEMAGNEQGKMALPPRPPPLNEREDGEGSEGNEMSLFPSSFSNKTGLIPLDKLLSSSVGSDEEREVLSLEKYETLQSEMVASNTRVKHLAALLSEAEKDSALMEEQNAVLKEEIRRLQRCLERQPHAHNVEYLKNVVFKFATLGSGDEKSRLVPVLDTILKLSPDEHKQLTAVAKGETEQTSGWSSYLPSWQ